MAPQEQMDDAPEATFGKVHVPYGEDGSGHYSLATKGCFDVIEQSKPICMKALGDVALGSAGEAFVLADYGTADGGTSMPLMSALIADVRRRDPSREIVVQYEDQPNNDFKSLFFYVQGVTDLGRKGYSQSYLKEFDTGVFVTVSGTSFFDQCFPTGSVHLGMSFTAMHWLSAKPCNIADGVHMTHASVEERAKLAAQAAADYERILLNRARELATGGRLVIVNFCVDSENQFLGKTHSSSECMFENFRKHWRAMRDEGRITPAEYEEGTILNYYRSDEEMRAPFQEGHAVHAAGLRLASSTSMVTPCPYRAQFLKEGGDPAATAKGIIGTMRTWSNSSFLTALSESRPMAERVALVDEFYGRYEKEIATDPSKHHMDYVHHYVTIEKV